MSYAELLNFSHIAPPFSRCRGAKNFRGAPLHRDPLRPAKARAEHVRDAPIRGTDFARFCTQKTGGFRGNASSPVDFVFNCHIYNSFFADKNQQKTGKNSDFTFICLSPSEYYFERFLCQKICRLV